MTPARKVETELRLGLRDILTVIGVAVTLALFFWGVASDLKVSIATFGERLGSIDNRVKDLEEATFLPQRRKRIRPALNDEGE